MSGPGIASTTPAPPIDFEGVDEMAQRTCSVEGCEKRHLARDLCSAHYQRLKAHGDPLGSAPPRPTPEDRFWSYVDKNGPGGCWLWTGYVDTKGYGRFHVRPVGVIGAHRFAYELLVGPIPAGLDLDHVYAWGCRHRNCVNPEHLEPVTPEENTLRSTNPAATNARKTHCPQGHPYDAVNTYTASDGKRSCKACRKAAQERRWRR